MSTEQVQGQEGGRLMEHTRERTDTRPGYKIVVIAYMAVGERAAAKAALRAADAVAKEIPSAEFVGASMESQHARRGASE